MAVATIKDLLDPLSKIQATSESSADSLSAINIALGAQVTGNDAMMSKMDKLIRVSSGMELNALDIKMLINLRRQTKLLEIIAAAGGKVKSAKGGGKDSPGLKSSGSALKMLGAGTAAMAKGLLLFSLVPKKTVTKFNDFIKTQIELWADTDTKKMEEGAKVMHDLGDSIYNFSKSLALSSLLLIPAAIGIPILYLATALLVPLFLLLGMGAKQIKKGAKSLDMMGDAIKSFAIGLAIFAITTFFILMQPAILLGMVASLILIGGAVAILGVFSKQIKKGSVALAVMGIGLGIFGFGYAIFALAVATTAPTMKAIAIQAGILIGIGVVTAILGSMFSLIIQGALSLAVMGLGLLVFGLGYIPFSYATKDTTLEDIGIQAGVLTALGGVFALAGLGVIPIVAGGVAFGAVGLALQELAPGLAAIKKVDFTEKDALKLTTTLAGVKAAFVGPPSKGGVSGFFSSIGGAITGTIDAGAMTAAAIGFGAAGIALTKLSVGLKAYQKLDWTNEQSLQLAGVLSGITTAFAQAGGEAATPTGIFGAVFGNAFSPNATKKGIQSVMGAGKALTSIAEGLTEFQKLVESEVDFDVLGVAISKTVGFIQRAFAAVAEEGNVDAGGFFGSLLGLKQNKVEEGIDSVMNAGKALTGIVDGLTAFQVLVDKKIDFPTLGKAISDTIGFVQNAFAAVADEGTVKAGGFFNSLFGIKKNKVQEGIDSVSGAGDQLKTIADALTSFAGLKNPAETASKIKAVLGMVGQAFASIGGSANEESDGNWFISWDENKIAKGIDAVDGAGKALTDIASGLKAFSGDFDPVAVATSVGTLLTSIGTAFSTLYATNPRISPQLVGFSTFIVTLGDVAEKGLLDKAADGISKIADSINKIDIDKTIAFGDLFKSSAKLSEDDKAYRALAKAVEDIRDMMAEGGVASGSSFFGSGVNAIKGALGMGSDKPITAAPTATKGPDPMKRLNSTLGRLESAITALPTNIQTMKLEVSLPNQ